MTAFGPVNTLKDLANSQSRTALPTLLEGASYRDVEGGHFHRETGCLVRWLIGVSRQGLRSSNTQGVHPEILKPTDLPNLATVVGQFLLCT